MKHFKIILIFLANICVLVSCNFFSDTEIVNFELPNIQNDLEILYFDSSGNLQKKVFTCEELKTQTSETRFIQIEVNKNSCTGVFAFCPTKLSNEFSNVSNNICDSSKNFGCIYPYSTKLCSENAFASKTLFLLNAGSSNNFQQTQNFLNHFNWQRFLKDCAEKENIWSCNMENIMKKIASGTYKKSDLK